MIKSGLLVLLVGLSSCGFYRQNVINAPLMEQKGQAQLGAHMSFNGAEGQAAYAVSNKIALLANYAAPNTKKEEYSSFNFQSLKHYFKEIGGGAFRTKPSGKIEELLIFAGNGMTTHIVTGKSTTGVVSSTMQEVKYNRFTIQGDFGKKNKKLEHIFTTRLLGVHYYSIADNSRSDYQDLSKLHIYAEEVVTFQHPICRFLLLSGQVCTTIPLTDFGGYNYYYEFSPFNASLGLIFNAQLLKPGTKN